MFNSSLYDEKTFYQTFLRDLEKCQSEVIIESPYITSERMKTFDRIFKKLLEKGIKIYVLTRLDRNVLWEGSLNILSQTYSREIMRRIESEQLTLEMFNFLKLGRYII